MGIERALQNEIDDILKLRKGSIMFISSYILPDVEINIIVKQSAVLAEFLVKGVSQVSPYPDNFINLAKRC